MIVAGSSHCAPLVQAQWRGVADPDRNAAPSRACTHALPGSGWTSGVVSEADQKTVWGTVFPTNALALMVQAELKLDPHSGVTVVFRSKRGDRFKILVWVSHGRATGSSGHGARPAWC